MPPETAYLICFGIAFTIYVRILNTDNKRNIIPAQKTEPRAVSPFYSQSKYNIKSEVGIKTHAGSDKDRIFCIKPHHNSTYRTNKYGCISTPLNGIPVLLIIAGFTTIIYMPARKVVMPARNSVLIFVLFSSREKYFSKLLIFNIYILTIL